MAVPPDDPLWRYLVDVAVPVEPAELDALASPTVDRLRAEGVELLVPIVASGRLLGTVALGPRRSELGYAAVDRRLLGRVAAAVAPAIRVANLVEEQRAAAQRRQRIDHELEVASLIQQTLLPRELPNLPGWRVDAFYRPALEVGGDFYDFVGLDADRLAFMVGDVTDKGVPAALVMATTRSHLRAAAGRDLAPSDVLRSTNELLVQEIPSGMFVTCLYGVLDTRTGDVVMANAGHNLPYLRTGDEVRELRATGMPLGLMTGMDYEETRATVPVGATVVLTSDGIAETQGPDGELFGLRRLRAAVAVAPDDELMAHLLGELWRWAGEDAKPDDDVTLCAIRRLAHVGAGRGARRLDAFGVASHLGAEREVVERVERAVAPYLVGPPLARLRTAVAEAAMNAVEHGNGADPGLEVEVEVCVDDDRVVVRVADHGGDAPLPAPEVPDLAAKLAGAQRPRGWGLFLIDEMVDDLRTTTSGDRRVVELVVKREELP